MSDLPSELARLSRREREIMEIVYAHGSATSAEVRAAMAEPPSYSAVRAQMRVLVEKNCLKVHQDGVCYVFQPTVPVTSARKSALTKLMQSFFNNSAVSVVATLLASKDLQIDAEELRQLKALIAQKEKDLNP